MAIRHGCKEKKKVKAVPLQAWSGPQGFKKLRFPDFMTTAQDGGKFVSLTHRPPLPQETHLVLISVRGCVECRGNESSNIHDIEHNYVWAWRELPLRVTGHDKTEFCVSDVPRV